MSIEARRQQFALDLRKAIENLRDVLREQDMDIGRIMLLDAADGGVLRYMLDSGTMMVPQTSQPAIDPETKQHLRQVEIDGVLVQWPAIRVDLGYGRTGYV